MKKIVLPVLLIGLLTACAGDNSDSKKSNQALIGKWQTIKEEEYSGNDFKDLEYSEVNEEENNSCPDYTEFKSDGSCQTVDMDANCAHETNYIGPYTFDGTNFKITVEGESQTYKVVSLSTTEISMEEIYTEDAVTYKHTIFFKKLK